MSGYEIDLSILRRNTTIPRDVAVSNDFDTCERIRKSYSTSGVGWSKSKQSKFTRTDSKRSC